MGADNSNGKRTLPSLGRPAEIHPCQVITCPARVSGCIPLKIKNTEEGRGSSIDFVWGVSQRCEGYICECLTPTITNKQTSTRSKRKEKESL